jgi:hypothetical protein
MTAEEQAVVLVNEVRAERQQEIWKGVGDRRGYGIVLEALCRAIEQHEAFKQKVGDIAAAYNQMAFTVSETEPHLSNYRVIIGFDKSEDASMCHDRLVSLLDFLKPKPDPLVDVLADTYGASLVNAGDLRAALEARGLEIREKGQ